MLFNVLVIGWAVLFAVYWCTYVLFRNNLNKSKYIFIYLFNTSLLAAISLFFYVTFLKLGILNTLNLMLILIMVVSGILHHFTLYLTYIKKKKSKTINLLHGPITHILFFTTFGYLSAYGGLCILPQISSLIYRSILTICIVVSLVTALVGANNWILHN